MVRVVFTSNIPDFDVCAHCHQIECCIDEWIDGTHIETEWDERRFKTVYQSHISSLNDFWQHDRAQGANLFEYIRADLLKEAR